MIRFPVALALAAALAAPAALAAQDPAPRDTIVILPRDGDAGDARSDTLNVDTGEAPARRPSRRGQPFAVRSSGRVAPHAPARDVVWIHPDSIRRPASEAADTVPMDSIVVTAPDDDAPEAEGEILLDTASVDDDRPARRRASSTDEEAAPSTRRRGSSATDADAPPSTRRRTTATDEDAPTSTRRRAAASDEEAPASTRRRAAAADEEDATPSTRRRNAADEDAPPSTRRRTAAADEEDTPPSTRRRTAAADEDADAEPAPRRTTRADSAATRRTTAAARAAARDSAARRATTATRPAAGARARTHKVASGETLFAIARRYGVTAAQLRALNPDVEGERLEVGAELRLPAGARTPAQSGQRATATGERATTPTRPAAQRGRRSHTVESGETVFGLARRYGVTAAAIREANDLDEDARLRIGQTLVIPRAPQQ